MSALSHFLESEGLATTGISLVRPHTEQMEPPRALWVPFELGRPFGAPADAAFQRRVLEAALGLLDMGPRPVLEDFPDDAPVTDAPIGENWGCPVSFPPLALLRPVVRAREEATLQLRQDMGVVERLWPR